MTTQRIDWDALEAIIRHDPGGRGLASYRGPDAPRGLGFGDLQRAAEELAQHAARVAIVTGFCIVDADPPAAETDGPPGALLLAQALAACGVDVVLVTDAFGMPLLHAGIKALGLDSVDSHAVELCEWPGVAARSHELSLEARVRFARDFLRTQGERGLTHVVATERVGPSHTPASVVVMHGIHRAAKANEMCDGASETVDGRNAALFLAEVTARDHDVCHNMRGKDIGQFTAPVHDLFDLIASERVPITTIGIGDGGNEIGMGRFGWRMLRDTVKTGPAAITACRVATDLAIVAGVSDWGAYALALATAVLRGQSAVARAWNELQQARLLERLVAAGAVDGVKKDRVVGVDGLTADEYLRPLVEMRQLLGLV